VGTSGLLFRAEPSDLQEQAWSTAEVYRLDERPLRVPRGARGRLDRVLLVGGLRALHRTCSSSYRSRVAHGEFRSKRTARTTDQGRS
jgi:hypothetical protein